MIIDPKPYLDSLIFYCEFRPKGELFTDTAVVYHETKDSIKRYIKNIEIRNGWECVGVRYKEMKTGRVCNYDFKGDTK